MLKRRIKAVEKFALLKRIRFKYIAFKASTATFSDIIQMYIRDPNATWDCYDK